MLDLQNILDNSQVSKLNARTIYQYLNQKWIALGKTLPTKALKANKNNL